MKLTYQEYCDKVKGCYLGKNIGGTLGAPFECFRGVYDIDFFMQDVSSPVPNDDVDLQLVWLSAVEHEGKNLDSHVLAQYWENYVSAVISEYGTGKNNYQMGICPPLSGYMRNENRESNGAWIRTEIWACLCAGNPALAANYAYYDACVDHSGEGVNAAVFIAACATGQASFWIASNAATTGRRREKSYLPPSPRASEKSGENGRVRRRCPQAKSVPFRKGITISPKPFTATTRPRVSASCSSAGCTAGAISANRSVSP